MKKPLTKIDIGHDYAGKIAMREALYTERNPLPFQQRMLAAEPVPYRSLIAASMGSHLTIKEAFAATCYVLRASNSALEERFFGNMESFGPTGDCMAAREMLSGLAMKEAWGGLQPQEVAGMIAAAMLDVMAIPPYGDRVLETCGMGGDRGILVNGDTEPCKTINGSTLTALLMASLGYRTAKHGSYSNTSSVGSTNAIESLGLIVDIPDLDTQNRFAEGTFHYTDAHAWKTIHDLSHLQPRRETVNHVIGPMTPPVSHTTRLDKILGVNEKMDPATIAEAYSLLHMHGIFNVGNIAVVCGLDRRPERHEISRPEQIREHVILDELSPFGSVVAFTRRSAYLGTYILTPADFGITFLDPFSIFVRNSHEDIMEANRGTITGARDAVKKQLPEYLAMNAALAMYLCEGMDTDIPFLEHGTGPSRARLKQYANTCLVAIRDGRLEHFLSDLVKTTKTAASKSSATK